MVLRRSHGERKFAISNNYVVYLRESKNDLSVDNDLVSFLEALNGDNFAKWLHPMNDELKLMTHNYVLWNFHKDVRYLGVNGSLRLCMTLTTISNVIRSDLLPKVLF